MKNLILTLALTILIPAIAGASCLPFIGHYKSSGCTVTHNDHTYADNQYSGLVVTASAADQISIYYQDGSTDGGYSTSYIADGAEHAGDIYNTGRTYTASCAETQVQTVRTGLFQVPLKTTFAKNSDGTFTLTEAVNSPTNAFARVCSFVKM